MFRKITKKAPTIVRNGLIVLLKIYQYLISPIYRPCCRFEPTCSHYCKTAILHHGALKGMWMGLWRVLKCHPLHRGGYDPVTPSELEKHGQ